MAYNNDILGWMTEIELKVLEKIVNKVPINGNIIELGSMFGRSAVCMAMSVKDNVKIFCIDFFPNDMIQIHQCLNDDSFPISGKLYDVEKIFIENTKDFSNIIMIKGYAPNIDYNFPLIDMFFLDISHKNPDDWNNLCHFVPYIKLGGIISGHDYCEEFPDVKENVKKLERIFDNNAIIYENTSLWSIIVTKKITESELINYES